MANVILKDIVKKYGKTEETVLMIEGAFANLCKGIFSLAKTQTKHFFYSKFSMYCTDYFAIIGIVPDIEMSLFREREK